MQRLLIINKSIAPYHRELYQHAAAALGPGVQILLILPTDGKLICADGSFDRDLVIPEGDNIDVRIIRGLPFHIRGIFRNQQDDWGRHSILPDRELVGAIRDFRPDVTWLHELSPYVLPALAMAKLRGRTVVMSSEVGRSLAHGFPPHVRVMHRLGGWLVDGIIANAHCALHPLADQQDNVVRAFHAVDSHRYPKTCQPSGGAGKIRLVALGHINHRKGPDLLFKAMAECRARGIGVGVRLIGGGDLDWARAEAEACGVADAVEFAGFLQADALRTALSDADAFVLPSRLDTYAAVCHEAACVGLPLLISKHAGASHAVVDPAANGFVIDPGDTTDFADKICHLAEDNTRLRAFSDRSREMGEALCARQNGARVAAWIQETASRRSTPQTALGAPA